MAWDWICYVAWFTTSKWDAMRIALVCSLLTSQGWAWLVRSSHATRSWPLRNLAKRGEKDTTPDPDPVQRPTAFGSVADLGKGLELALAGAINDCISKIKQKNAEVQAKANEVASTIESTVDKVYMPSH